MFPAAAVTVYCRVGLQMVGSLPKILKGYEYSIRSSQVVIAR
jgi:hypothetical protein